MVRDHDEDAAFGARTTAVALGTTRAFLLQRILLLLAATFTATLVHNWVGIAMVLTALLPFDPHKATAHWNSIRLALGTAWIAIIGWVLWSGKLSGFVTEPRFDAVLW